MPNSPTGFGPPETADPSANLAPFVDAGPNTLVYFSEPLVSLDGTAGDDGNPSGTLVMSWSVESGPGTVTFGDATAVDTTATFSAVGTYELKLEADDSELTGSDTVTITVVEAAQPAPEPASLPFPSRLPHQIVVDPANRGYLFYNRDDNGDGRADLFYMGGPGDPEGFLYNSDMSNGYSQSDVINEIDGDKDSIAVNGGANSVYFHLIRDWGGDGDQGEHPFVSRTDFTLDQGKLDQYQAWIAQFESQNIVVSLFFYDDKCKVPWNDGTSDYVVGPAEDAYISGIVNRFESHANIIWVVAEEYSEGYGDLAARMQHVSDIAAVIREQDDYDHPIGVHQLNGNTFDFADDPNIDVFYLQQFGAQDVYSNTAAAWNAATDAVTGKQRYVVNFAESAQAHRNALIADPNDDDKLRKKSWEAAMAGGYVMWLGAFAKPTVGDPPNATNFRQVRYLIDFIENADDYIHMAPHAELAGTGTKFVLANPGISYLAYDDGGVIGLRDVPAGDWKLNWLDAVSGLTVSETLTLAAGDHTLTKPAEFGQEIACYIRFGDGDGDGTTGGADPTPDGDPVGDADGGETTEPEPDPAPESGTETEEFLLVDFGGSPSENLTPFPEWTTVIVSSNAGYSNAGPAGIKMVSGSGLNNFQGVIGTERQFDVGDRIVVTWYNDSGGRISFLPLISFTDSDQPDGGSVDGQWYQMSAVNNMEPGTTATTFYDIHAPYEGNSMTAVGTSTGTYSLINICMRNANVQGKLVCDRIELNNGADITPPTVPQNLRAPADGIKDNQVRLEWDPSTDENGVNRYWIYRDGRLVGYTQIGQGATYTDHLLTPSTTYEYTVTALDVTDYNNPDNIVHKYNESDHSDPIQVTTAPFAGSDTVIAPLDDMVYLGAFRLPKPSGSSSWKYSGQGIAYYPAGDAANVDGDVDENNAPAFSGSLFGIGHSHDFLSVSEISIPRPAISPAKDVNDLNTATTLQPFASIGLHDPGQLPVGALEYLEAHETQTDDKLYFSWQSNYYYGPKKKAFGWTAIDSLSVLNSEGTWHIGSADGTPLNYQYGKFLFRIPQTWADSNAPGKLMGTGFYRGGGLGGQGPSLYAFEPSHNGLAPPDNGELDYVTLLQYPTFKKHDLYVDSMNGFHESDNWHGAAWLTAGTKSALVVTGRKALGHHWYGYPDGTQYHRVKYDIPETYTGGSEKGNKESGNLAMMLFYDPEDLTKVAKGDMNAWEPQPYAAVDLSSIGYSTASIRRQFGGITFDREHGLLYAFEIGGEKLPYSPKALAHVWKVAENAVATAPPVPDPAPEPEPDPAPDPGPDPAPDPEPDPAPEPEPAPEDDGIPPEGGPPGPTIEDGLRVHYNLNDPDEIGDQSGNGNDGTASGAIFTPDGFIDGAYDFDGDSDYLTTPSSDSFGGSSFSAAAWIKADDVTSQRHLIFGRQLSSNRKNFQMSIETNSKLTFSTYSGCAGSPTTLESPATLSAGTWYHVVFVLEHGVEKRMYIDGQRVALSTQAATVPTGCGSQATSIGANLRNPATTGFDGIIDDVAIWDKPLSDAEVLDVFQDGLGFHQAPCSLDADCDDGDLCNGLETCDTQGECQPGLPLDCSSFDSECTVGQCDAVAGCYAEFLNAGTPCEDGDRCNGVETCDDAGICQAGQLVDCSFLDGECIVGVCNPETGECEAVPASEGAPCDDGVTCTTGSVCISGVCAAGIPDDSLCFSDEICDVFQGCVAQLHCADSTDEGLRLYYFLDYDGTVTDHSGNGNSGTVSGATFTTSGYINGAYDFDGTSDYVKTPSDDFYGGASFTASAWIKAYDVTSQRHLIFGRQLSGSRKNFQMGIETDSKLTFSTYSGCAGSPTTLESPYDLSTEIWYHVVFVLEHDVEKRIYIDGQRVASSTQAAKIPKHCGSQATSIGSNLRKPASTGFDGIIDEVAIWNRALTDDEVKSVYDHGIPCP